MWRLIKPMLAEVLQIIYPKSTFNQHPLKGCDGGYDVIFQSTYILLVFCHPSVLKMSQSNLSSNDDINTMFSPKIRVKVAPGWKATVDKIGLPSLLDHTSVMFSFCSLFTVEYLATIGFHCVEFFPAVKLRNGYVDWKISPEPSSSSGWLVNGRNFNF